MALGSTPSLTEINTELGTSGQSLVTCIANAGQTGTWDRQSDFANYTHLYLTVGVGDLYFDSTGQPSQDITVTSNTTWSAVNSDTWIWVTGDSGSGNDVFQVECQGNSGSQRSGTVTLDWSGTDRIVNIHQTAP